VRLYPGDIGTKGGYVISPHGQVLDTGGEVIEGLYACGNSTACAMGRVYPGAGGTIGPAMTFAYIAMRPSPPETADPAACRNAGARALHPGESTCGIAGITAARGPR
jgi:3-oxosteroid 1-dehydrogenase